MNTYEELEDEAYNCGIEIVPHKFNSDRIKGLYCDNVIAISKDLKTTAEKECVLAEEMAHHYTSTGDIIDMNDSGNRKQELRARLYAYNRKVGLQGIIAAHKARCCHNAAETADYLNVTEAFLLDAIDCYRSKYGTYTVVDNYIVGFEPTLYVIERFE